jgi:CHAD domain-containing protein
MTVSDTSYQMLVCQYIKGQVKVFKRHIRGSRLARDIEYVHQARVASRRLRTALQICGDCFPRGKSDRWRMETRRLTKRLGKARDTDVQIDFLKKFIADIPSKSDKLRAGLRRLMLRLKQRRHAIQPKVVKTLDRLDKRQILDEIITDINRITAGFGKQYSKIQSPFVFQRAQEHIRDRLVNLFSFEHSLDDPRDGKGHHQMRIAAKRLRYTLEICNLPFEKKLDEHIRGIKHIQSLLGELHDYEVWLDDIKQFSADEKTRMLEYLGSIRAFKRLKKGIDYFVRQIKKERKKVYEQSVLFWKQLAEQDFWNKLNSILQEHNVAITQTGPHAGIGKEVTDANKTL